MNAIWSGLIRQMASLSYQPVSCKVVPHTATCFHHIKSDKIIFSGIVVYCKVYTHINPRVDFLQLREEHSLEKHTECLAFT